MLTYKSDFKFRRMYFFYNLHLLMTGSQILCLWPVLHRLLQVPWFFSHCRITLCLNYERGNKGSEVSDPRFLVGQRH